MSRLLLLIVLFALPVLSPAADEPPVAPPGLMIGVGITGGPGTYSVRAGDNLTLVAARLGASLAQLRAENFPGPQSGKANALRVGQQLVYENRHVVPPAPVAEGDALVINLPQRMLFHFRDGRLRAAYPVAVGKHDWQTPITVTRITSREKDKTWVVPPSIQKEMRAKGEPVLTRVPAGPDNPLGRYWLGLALPGYGIHGTNAPASVYSARTHGCLRLQPEHIEELFANVTVGTPVWTIYTPVLLYLPPDGPIWLEAHPDAYAHRLDLPGLVRMATDAAGVTERVDPVAAESQLTRLDGIARNVAVGAPVPAKTPAVQPRGE